MTEWVIPLTILVASLSATYFFCLRPMRRGHCAMTPPARTAGAGAGSSAHAAELAELAELREQLETLKMQQRTPSRR